MMKPLCLLANKFLMNPLLYLYSPIVFTSTIFVVSVALLQFDGRDTVVARTLGLKVARKQDRRVAVIFP